MDSSRFEMFLMSSHEYSGRLRLVPRLPRRGLAVFPHLAAAVDGLPPRPRPPLAARGHAPRLALLIPTYAVRAEPLLPLVPPPCPRAVLRPLVRPLPRLPAVGAVLLAPLLPPRLRAVQSALLHLSLDVPARGVLLPPLLVPLVVGLIARPLVRAPLDELRADRPGVVVSIVAFHAVHLFPRLPPRVAVFVEPGLLRAELFEPGRVALLPVRLSRFPARVLRASSLDRPSAPVPVIADVDAGFAKHRVPVRVHAVRVVAVEVDPDLLLGRDPGVPPRRRLLQILLSVAPAPAAVVRVRARAHRHARVASHRAERRRQRA
eukprot:31310-Pelagococcus_subviridis.AAC.20